MDLCFDNQRLVKRGHNVRMNLAIMLSRQCNLNCSYCIVSRKNDHTVIPFETVIEYLIDLAPKSTVELTGGEPMLHTHLITQILDWANKQTFNLRWVVTTNGQIIPTEHFIENYLSKFYSIRISIDGPQEFHDFHRGAGSFDNAMRFLSVLHNKGLRRIRLNPTFTKYSVRHLHTIVQWFHVIQKRFELPCLNLNLNFADKNDWSDTDFIEYETQLDLVLHWYEALSETDKKFISLACLKRARSSSSKFFGYFAVCSAGISVFGLSPYGEIVPCITDLYKNNTPGHVTLNSFSADNDYRNLTMKVDYPDCFSCNRYLCGPCPPLFKMMTDDIRKIPANFCKFGKITDELLHRFIQQTTDITVKNNPNGGYYDGREKICY